jgi:hypothetical protein
VHFPFIVLLHLQFTGGRGGLEAGPGLPGSDWRAPQRGYFMLRTRYHISGRLDFLTTLA